MLVTDFKCQHRAPTSRKSQQHNHSSAIIIWRSLSVAWNYFKKLHTWKPSLAWFNRAIKPFSREMAAACSGDMPSTCSSQIAMISRIFDKNFILKTLVFRLVYFLVWALPRFWMPIVSGNGWEIWEIRLYRLTHSMERKHFQVCFILNCKGFILANIIF